MVQLDDPRIREALDDDAPLPRMSFGDHLDELRVRVIKSLLAIVVAVVVVFPFKLTVQEIVIEPYRTQWRMGFTEYVANLEVERTAGTLDELGEKYLTFCLAEKEKILGGEYRWAYQMKELSGYPVPYNLYATGGLEDFLSFMWVALIFALVLASPVVIWQIWAFIGAGLYKHERAVFYRYFPFMIGLFGAGVYFGYRLALPYSLGFLIGMMDPSMVGAIFSVGQFLTLLFMTTAAMGVVFQVPLVMLALQKVGLVRHKAFTKHWRMTVLVMFVMSAIFTPPEPVSMLMMSMPMMMLYGLGLVLTGMGQKNEAPLPEGQ
jgi:sec-independent protein translocase protein TatC